MIYTDRAILRFICFLDAARFVREAGRVTLAQRSDGANGQWIDLLSLAL